jgi:hypothetical protein
MCVCLDALSIFSLNPLSNVIPCNKNCVLLEGTLLRFLSSVMLTRCLCQSLSGARYSEESVNRQEGHCVKPLFTNAAIIIGRHMKLKFLFIS